MAASTSSSVFMVGVITLFLLIASCSATRPGAMLLVEDGIPKAPGSGRKLYLKAFQLDGQQFNFFPKGVPIPPSGPSKRHNSIEN
ncbi:Protein IDA-LIKE 1 [Linum grandiflorum]